VHILICQRYNTNFILFVDNFVVAELPFDNMLDHYIVRPFFRFINNYITFKCQIFSKLPGCCSVNEIRIIYKVPQTRMKSLIKGPKQWLGK
jgi:hypothetical protein